eukprot:CAMPEP_0202713802 /NCGR_PEP_ID=MMETSP1385-20130828/59672_1 /ASSEMBLY_ACC=CAM_ASM_000861 /TAXON_ID=933848 /ORGANISM="Elphidium margaritaceum" /LENGTH=294 /DNA_ID=CAMNT_0049374289 /DNA_START=34 /DNA_END=918 /DNA_ORIENTATION=-
MSDTEGAENSNEELSSSDLDSSSVDTFGAEHYPLQKDMHQKHLIDIRKTDQKKKKDGELRYIIVGDEELDEEPTYDVHTDNDDEDEDNMTYSLRYTLDRRRKTVAFPLKQYPSNDNLIILAFIAAAICIFILIILIPLLQEIVTILNAILASLTVVFVAVGIFLDGKFYLVFDYKQQEILVTQKMCCGACMCGRRGVEGKVLGSLTEFVDAHTIKLNDIIGEATWRRWQYLLVFKDHENGEQVHVLFTTSNEHTVGELDYNVNSWRTKIEQCKCKDVSACVCGSFDAHCSKRVL